MKHLVSRLVDFVNHYEPDDDVMANPGSDVMDRLNTELTTPLWVVWVDDATFRYTNQKRDISVADVMGSITLFYPNTDNTEYKLSAVTGADKAWRLLSNLRHGSTWAGKIPAFVEQGSVEYLGMISSANAFAWSIDIVLKQVQVPPPEGVDIHGLSEIIINWKTLPHEQWIFSYANGEFIPSRRPLPPEEE